MTSPPPPEKRVAEGVLESKRKKHLKRSSDRRESLFWLAPDAGFDPTTLYSLIHDFVRSDLDTHTLNLVKEKLFTFIQGFINIFQNPDELKSERQKRLKLISNLKECLLWCAPNYCFDPTNLFYLIDAFVRSDLDTHTLNQVKEKLYTFIQGLVNKDELNIMSIDETEKPMRMLISNGYEICVVDIKDNPRSGVEYLPKIAALNLVEKQLPVSVGLFRIGSDAYMICGQTLPTDIINNVALLHSKFDSFETYSLSITNNGTLLHSKCNSLKLNTPKSFPVVVDFDGKLHVFDSCPNHTRWACRPLKFSHEVIGEGSLKIKGPSHLFIMSYLVLGNHIFAATVDHKHLLFDSTNSKWIVHHEEYGGYLRKRPVLFKTVWDILSFGGKAICVDKIKLQNDSYYVVLELLTEFIHGVENDDDVHGFTHSVFVVAYLVTSKGDIAGRQTLHGFFNGPVQPSFVMTSAIMKGGGTDGKTICVALTGEAIIGDTKQVDQYFFFSNTFTVEAVVNNFKSNMTRILKADCGHGIVMDRELVRIDIKDRCVYKIVENDIVSLAVSTEVCFF